MKAVPELSGSVPGVEMSHEAAVGKIDRREIVYLMARGLDEDEAISTIVRGFLNVDIEGASPGTAAAAGKGRGRYPTGHDVNPQCGFTSIKIAEQF